MFAYRLMRLRKDGTLGPLFVGRTQVVRTGDYLRARRDLPHNGLAYRPGFHCCARPSAPHIKRVLKNGKRRVWCLVSVYDYDWRARNA